MNLSAEMQQKLVSALGCLIESGKQYDHTPDCECQLCMDLRSAEDLISDVEDEIAPAELPVFRPFA